MFITGPLLITAPLLLKRQPRINNYIIIIIIIILQLGHLHPIAEETSLLDFDLIFIIFISKSNSNEIYRLIMSHLSNSHGLQVLSVSHYY